MSTRNLVASTNENNNNYHHNDDSEVFNEEQPPSLITATCSTRSIILIFLTRFIRMFLFGACGVIFLLFLTEDKDLNFTTIETTIALVCVYVGDWLLSLFLSSRADKYGRRLILILSSLLLSGLGVCFYLVASKVVVVIIVGFFGIVSPSGSELGPFLAIEQSALADILCHFFSTYYPSQNNPTHARMRKELLPASLTTLISWYQLFGSFSQAGGALAAGYISNFLIDKKGFSASTAYQTLFLGYAVAGGVLCLIYMLLGSDVEMSEEDLEKREIEKLKQANKIREFIVDGDLNEHENNEGPCVCASILHYFGLFRPKTQSNVLLFSFLFFWDAFAGGLIIQSYISWYFHKRWKVELQHLGLMFMGVNLLAAISGLLAGWLVKKIGAISTMVFTHAPSNVLLALIVFMPNSNAAMAMLLLRSCISQMDVPARQAYVALVVPKDEKSSANGITNSVRSLAVALAAIALVPMLKAEQHSDKVFWNSVPFVAAGGLKLIYDLSVYTSFKRATGEVGKQEKQDGGERAPLISR